MSATPKRPLVTLDDLDPQTWAASADEFYDFEQCENCGYEWPPEELEADGWCPDCAAGDEECV